MTTRLPAIISKELYYRVQDRLRDPNKTRKHDIDFAYTGLINCGHCGCQLTAELKKDRRGNPKYIYYHCTGNRGGNCNKDWTSEETLDNAISEVIKLIVIPMGVRENIVKGLKTIHEKKMIILNRSKIISYNRLKGLITGQNKLIMINQMELGHMMNGNP